MFIWGREYHCTQNQTINSYSLRSVEPNKYFVNPKSCCHGIKIQDVACFSFVYKVQVGDDKVKNRSEITADLLTRKNWRKKKKKNKSFFLTPSDIPCLQGIYGCQFVQRQCFTCCVCFYIGRPLMYCRLLIAPLHNFSKCFCFFQCITYFV